MRQQTLAAQAGFEKYGRKSRRELFLDEMEQVVPWSGLQSLVEPHYAKAGNGRRPVGLGIMLRTLLCAAMVQSVGSRCGRGVDTGPRGAGALGLQMHVHSLQ